MAERPNVVDEYYQTYANCFNLMGANPNHTNVRLCARSRRETRASAVERISNFTDYSRDIETDFTRGRVKSEPGRSIDRDLRQLKEDITDMEAVIVNKELVLKKCDRRLLEYKIRLEHLRMIFQSEEDTDNANRPPNAESNVETVERTAESNVMNGEAVEPTDNRSNPNAAEEEQEEPLNLCIRDIPARSVNNPRSQRSASRR